MPKLTYIPATPDRLNEIFKVFQEAKDTMLSNDINQWDEIYPDFSVIEDDISKGQMTMVLNENQIAAIYVVNDEFDPQYANGKWNEPEASFRVVHRLCVNPIFQNKGVAGSVMQEIEINLKMQGIESIRLDAFSENPFALRLYENLGYVNTGFADWRKGRFYLYEKKL